MHRNLIPTTLALGLVLLSAAAPAAARTPVPAGQVQHTIIDTVYPAATNTVHHASSRVETWTGSQGQRLLETNPATHKIKSDCQIHVRVMSRCWTPRDAFFPTAPAAGVIHLNPADSSPPLSWADIGQREKGAIAGRPTTPTTYLGLPALSVESAPTTAAGGATFVSKEIVDAQTFYPLWQETVITGHVYKKPDGTTGTQDFDEITKVTKLEVLRARGVKLTIAAHPGARVVNDVERAKGKHRR